MSRRDPGAGPDVLDWKSSWRKARNCTTRQFTMHDESPWRLRRFRVLGTWYLPLGAGPRSPPPAIRRGRGRPASGRAAVGLPRGVPDRWPPPIGTDHRATSPSQARPSNSPSGNWLGCTTWPARAATATIFFMPAIRSISPRGAGSATCCSCRRVGVRFRSLALSVPRRPIGSLES